MFVSCAQFSTSGLKAFLADSSDSLPTYSRNSSYFDVTVCGAYPRPLFLFGYVVSGLLDPRPLRHALEPRHSTYVVRCLPFLEPVEVFREYPSHKPLSPPGSVACPVAYHKALLAKIGGICPKGRSSLSPFLFGNLCSELAHERSNRDKDFICLIGCITSLYVQAWVAPAILNS
jgi:hypothetical protein